MLKKIALLFAALFCCLVFVGCGETAEGVDSPHTGDSTIHTTTAHPDSATSAAAPADSSAALSTDAQTTRSGAAGRSTKATTTSTSSKSSTKTTTAVSPSRTRPAIAMHREAKKDGLLLQVSTSYQHQFAGEPFTVTASITNTTRHDITYGLPSGTPNMHLEIRVAVRGENNIEFIDMDTHGKAMTEDYKYAVLKAGETFTQTIRFLPGYGTGGYWADLSSQTIHWYPAGTYNGTAKFSWMTGTAAQPGETKHVQLDFPVILV